MNRKIKTFFAAVSLFFTASVFSFAGEQDFVIDTADFLSSVEVETIEEIGAYAADYYGCGIYVALVDTYHPYSNVEDFSESVFLQNELGTGSEKNGVLLVVSVNEREYDICAHGSMGHFAFTDYGKNLLADSFINDLRYNDWSSALIHFTKEATVYLEAASNGEPIDVPVKEPMEQSEKIKLSLLVAAGISFLIALIICLVQKGKLISVKKAKNANSYVEMEKIHLTQQSDIFTHRTESRVKIETSSSSSSGRGGTSVNSRGFSHSSGKF